MLSLRRPSIAYRECLARPSVATIVERPAPSHFVSVLRVRVPSTFVSIAWRRPADVNVGFVSEITAPAASRFCTSVGCPIASYCDIVFVPSGASVPVARS